MLTWTNVKLSTFENEFLVKVIRRTVCLSCQSHKYQWSATDNAAPNLQCSDIRREILVFCYQWAEVGSIRPGITFICEPLHYVGGSFQLLPRVHWPLYSSELILSVTRFASIKSYITSPTYTSFLYHYSATGLFLIQLRWVSLQLCFNRNHQKRFF